MKDIKEPPKGDALGELCLALRYKPARYVVYALFHLFNRPIPFIIMYQRQCKLLVILTFAFLSRPPALVCQIVQCRNLKQMDLGGASDPYVKVSVGVILKFINLRIILRGFFSQLKSLTNVWTGHEEPQLCIFRPL